MTFVLLNENVDNLLDSDEMHICCLGRSNYIQVDSLLHTIIYWHSFANTAELN